VELKCRRKKPDETLQALSSDVERLVAMAYPGIDDTTRDILRRDAFIDALDNPGLEFRIREKEPKLFRQALTVAMRLEVLSKSKKMEKDNQRPRTTHTRGVTHEVDKRKQQGQQARPQDLSVGPADGTSAGLRGLASKERNSRVGNEDRQCKDSGQNAHATERYNRNGSSTARAPATSTRKYEESRRDNDKLRHEVEELKAQVATLLRISQASQPTTQADTPI